MTDAPRRWPGVDGWVVLGLGLLVAIGGVLRFHGGGLRWVLAVLAVDALYLAGTAWGRR